MRFEEAGSVLVFTWRLSQIGSDGKAVISTFFQYQNDDAFRAGMVRKPIAIACSTWRPSMRISCPSASTMSPTIQAALKMVTWPYLQQEAHLHDGRRSRSWWCPSLYGLSGQAQPHPMLHHLLRGDFERDYSLRSQYGRLALTRADVVGCSETRSYRCYISCR